MRNEALELLPDDRQLVARALGGRLQSLREHRTLPGNTTYAGSLADGGPGMLGLFGGAAKSGADVNEATAFNVSVFAACTNILAQSIAMLPLTVGQKLDRGSEMRPEHPAWHLLRRKPGPGQTSYQWRSHKVANVCLGGNGYSRIYRDANFKPFAIVPLKPSDVRPRLAASGRLIYIYRNVELLQDYEVVHWRGLSSNGYTGRNSLADMRDSMGLSMTAQEFTGRSFANGNRMPGVFEGSDTTTKEKAETFKKFWDDNYAGAMNAGKTPILIGGMKWKEAGFSNQDAELLMSRRFEVEEISRHFRIPLHLLNSTEKSTTWGSGIDQLNQGFVTYTLQPWLENFQQELEDKLLTEAEKADKYFIKFDLTALLRGSPETRAKFYETMRRIRAMSANEIRKLEDETEAPDTGANNLDWPLNAQAPGNAAPAAAAVPAGEAE